MAMRTWVVGATGALLAAAGQVAAQVAVEEARIVAPDAAAGDIFGSAVVLGTDVLAIGAPSDDSAGPNAGSVYLYRKIAGAWVLEVEINDPTSVSIGSRVAMQGSTIVASNPYVDVGGVGAAGVVDVFVESGGTWSLQAHLLSPAPYYGETFGHSIAISGDTVVVGAPGQFANPDRPGRAFVFVRSVGVWTLESTILASDARNGDEFGFGADIENDLAIVGAPGAGLHGSFYVVERVAGVWSELTKVPCPSCNYGNQFGEDVDLQGGRLLVGDRGDAANGYMSGALFLYEGGGATWTLQARLPATDGVAGDYYGAAAALDGDRAVGGAPYHSHGVNDAGAAYAVVRTPTGWEEQAEILAGVRVPVAYYGGAVDVLGDTAAVGSSGEDDVGQNSGAVYVYHLSPLGCALALAPATLPNGQAGTAYSQTITTTGGTAPYAYRVSRGTLPPGLLLSPSGVLSGTPTATGTYAYTVLSIDATTCANEIAYVHRIDCAAPLVVQPWGLPAPRFYVPYAASFSATGGMPPYTFAVASGSIPPGLTLAAGGAFTGTPERTGTWSFTVRATDVVGCAGTRAYSLTVLCTPDTCQGSWMSIATSAVPADRQHARMAYDSARGRVVLYGGMTGTLYFDDTWEYDGVDWSRVGVASGPPELALHGMAYDAVRRRVVIQGGGNLGSLYDDTWEYDGTGWQRRTLAPTPGVRFGHAMTFDAARGVVLLQGGYDAGYRELDDTWTYDGAGWVLGPDMAPAHYHQVVDDASRQLCVAYAKDRTWDYDGNAWVQGAPSPPELGLREEHGLAYDAARRRTVLFGGMRGTSITGDTWQLDDAAWVSTGEVPAALAGRRGAALAYDAARERVVMFGGGGFTWELGCVVRLSPSALPAASVGLPYGQTITASGGVPPYTFSISRGTLPPGLGLTPGGDLSGTPAASGSYEFDVRAEDASRSCNRAYRIDVVVPTVDYVVGPGPAAANPNRVRVVTAAGQPTPVDFAAYAAGTFGTNVACGDVDGGFLDEIVTGPGPGAVLGPQVRGFRADGTAIAKINYYAYGTLKYGVKGAGAELDLDGYDEILTAPGPGASFGPHVRGWDYDGVAIVARAAVNFFAYGTLQYGANVSRGDVQGDAHVEILTAPGPGTMFGPHVRGFRYEGPPPSPLATVNFQAFPVLQYGGAVAGGNVDADAFAEIVASPGPGPSASFPAAFQGFDVDGAVAQPITTYFVRPFPTVYGAVPALADMGAAPRLDLLAGAGPDPAADSTVKAYQFLGTWMAQLPGQFEAFAGTRYGVRVGGGTLGY